MSFSRRINLTITSNITCIRYYLYDALEINCRSINRLTYWNSSIEINKINEDIDLTKGTCPLAVTQYSSYTENFSFKLNFPSAGESFTETGNGTNKSLSTAIKVSLNTTYKGQFAQKDTKDFYKFTVSSSSTTTLSANAKINCMHYYIYDNFCNELWYDCPYWNNSTQQSSITKTIKLNKGTYYLAVTQYSSYTGNYSFKLSGTSGAAAHTHSYKQVITKTTPKSNGKIVKKCSCGKTSGTSTIYAPKTMNLSSSSYTYDGKVKTVCNSKGKTISSSNYKVSYSSGRKYVGKYTVKVTFTGKYYSGSMSKTFTIRPKSTYISSLTAKSKGFTARWGKQTSQTTGYQIQYSTNKNFSGAATKTITKNSTTSASYTKLKAKKKYYVRIRTYKKISNTYYYSSWSSAKTVTTK